jgi:hypothetical protein
MRAYSFFSQNFKYYTGMENSKNPLQGLLQQYTKQIERVHEEKQQIIRICSEVCGITLKESEIEIEGSVLRILTHPAKRQVLFMKKPDILHMLQTTHFPSLRDIC